MTYAETVAADIVEGDSIIMNGSGIAGTVLSARTVKDVRLFTIEGFENQHGHHVFRSAVTTRHYVVR